MAAADERIRDRLAMVALFGPYADFVAVIQGATTGFDVVGDTAHPWEPDPQAPELLREHAPDFVHEAERDPLRDALAGRRDPGALPPAARAAFALFTNEDPARTRPLFAGLDPDIRRATEDVSPVSVALLIVAPILVLHSRTDPAVPYAESLRLREHFPGARVLTLEVFNHVDFRPSARQAVAAVRDLRQVWRFITQMLRAQALPPYCRARATSPPT